MRDFDMANAKKTPSSPPPGGTWTLAGAKARLSELVDRAQAGPQIITRNGKPSAVVVSAEEWTRKTVRKGTLAEFLLASPLCGADLDLERQRNAPRERKAVNLLLNTNVLSEVRRPAPDLKVGIRLD
jgi:prevent-host-death family protein